MDALQKDRWDPTDQPSPGSVLIVEDDTRLMQCLARAMEVRGFKVTVARSVCDGLAEIQLSALDYAVVDMRLGDGCGLDVVAALKRRRPNARAIILTGYGNIETAVRAVKLGAVDYLTKPVDADDIVSALLAPLDGKADAPPHPMSPDHVRLQHIRQVHEASGRNVSETARRLNMHRRTLQRILSRQAGKKEVACSGV